MAFDAHTNFAYSTVATPPAPAASGTSCVVQLGDGAKFPSPPFNVTLWPPGVQPTGANAEIARVTAKAGDTFTITRGQEGSVARTVLAGDQISATITAKALQDLESTAAFTDQANTFTAPQTISGVLPALNLIETDQPANQRAYRVSVNGQTLNLQTLDDAGVAVLTPLILDRSGNAKVATDLYEKGRATPLGHGIPVGFSAGNFTGAGGMTWTVGAGDVPINRYALVGKQLLWSFRIVLSDLAGTASPGVNVTLPAGLVVASSTETLVRCFNTSWQVGCAQTTTAQTWVQIARLDNTAWTLGVDNFYVYANLVIEVT